PHNYSPGRAVAKPRTANLIEKRPAGRRHGNRQPGVLTGSVESPYTDAGTLQVMQIERLMTHADARPALTFPWGGIKWLCNRETDPEAAQTLGLVFINPGAHNLLHYHPNCEELLHVLSGTCDHRLG